MVGKKELGLFYGTKEEITIIEKKFKEICSDPYNHRFGLKIQRDLSGPFLIGQILSAFLPMTKV